MEPIRIFFQIFKGFFHVEEGLDLFCMAPRLRICSMWGKLQGYLGLIQEIIFKIKVNASALFWTFTAPQPEPFQQLSQRLIHWNPSSYYEILGKDSMGLSNIWWLFPAHTGYQLVCVKCLIMFLKVRFLKNNGPAECGVPIHRCIIREIQPSNNYFDWMN